MGESHTSDSVAKGRRFLDTPKPDAFERRPLDWRVLADGEPPARDWAVDHWLGMAHVTLLAGLGGIGKTLLAQMLASALALGRAFATAYQNRGPCSCGQPRTITTSYGAGRPQLRGTSASDSSNSPAAFSSSRLSIGTARSWSPFSRPTGQDTRV